MKKEWEKIVNDMPSVVKSFNEFSDEFLEICRGVLDPVSSKFPSYKALQTALWVCRERRDVKVKVKRFLKCRKKERGVFYFYIQIEKIGFLGWIFQGPL